MNAELAEVVQENLPQTEASGASAIILMIERAATNPAVDIDKMERLLQMQERIIEKNSKMAYASALARMMPELPIVGERGEIKNKDKQTQSTYALWEDIVGEITPILAKHGFSISFRTQNDANGVTVTGVLAHAEGHFEETKLTLPADTTGSKNAVQAIGSSTSYGKRYTASALLNLRTGEVDDDGASANQLVNDLQVKRLDSLLAQCSEKAKANFAKKYGETKSVKASMYEAIVISLENTAAPKALAKPEGATEKTPPVNDQQISLLRRKLSAKNISEADFFAAMKIRKFDGLKFANLNMAIDWIQKQ